jgi:hypothetical protein
MKLLNEDFEIIKYTGSSYNNEEKYKIENILQNTFIPHCSNIGNNFILILKSKNLFKLKIFTITGGR